MTGPEEPTEALLHGDDAGDGVAAAPDPPRVTPEPAPSDTVLIAAGVAAGVASTVAALVAWRLWRRGAGDTGS